MVTRGAPNFIAARIAESSIHAATEHYTGRLRDADNLATAPPLNIIAPNAAPLQRMPAGIEFELLPGVGRMIIRWTRSATPRATVDEATHTCVIPSRFLHRMKAAGDLGTTHPPSCFRRKLNWEARDDALRDLFCC